MKDIYVEPDIKIIELDSNDVITTSGYETPTIEIPDNS